MKNMPRLRTRCKVLCLLLFVMVSSVSASILLMHDIRSPGFRLLASGVDMVRVSNYGTSLLYYRSNVMYDHRTALCLSKHAVRLKEVLRRLLNLNAQASATLCLQVATSRQPLSNAKVPAVPLLMTAPNTRKHPNKPPGAKLA